MIIVSKSYSRSIRKDTVYIHLERRLGVPGREENVVGPWLKGVERPDCEPPGNRVDSVEGELIGVAGREFCLD
jgi:hypothetical protein